MNDGLALDGLRRLPSLRVKSIQRGTISVAGAQSGTATITAVNTARADLSKLGQAVNGTVTAFTDNETRLELTDSTTVTARRVGSTGTVTINFQVVEYY